MKYQFSPFVFQLKAFYQAEMVFHLLIQQLEHVRVLFVDILLAHFENVMDFLKMAFLNFHEKQNFCFQEDGQKWNEVQVYKS